MTDSLTIGEVTVIYEAHLSGNRREIVDEILAYELNGKRMTAKGIYEAGFEAPDDWTLQAELDFDYQEWQKP